MLVFVKFDIYYKKREGKRQVICQIAPPPKNTRKCLIYQTNCVNNSKILCMQEFSSDKCYYKKREDKRRSHLSNRDTT